MDIRNILFFITVTALLMGSAYGASINNFSIDKTFHDADNDEYYSLHLNDAKDAGVIIFKNVDDDTYGDDNDAYDDLIHSDGRDYLEIDDDYQMDKNPDNTANFTDIDHAEHGIVEVVKSDNQEYIVVFWAKDTSDMKNSDLMKQLEDFNKDNNVEAIAF